VTSALGFLVAAPAIDYVRSYVSRLDNLDWAHLNRLFDDMARDARALLVEAGAKPEEITLRRQADMRHVGQGFEIAVPMPEGQLGPQSLDAMKTLFLDTYQQLFDRRLPEVPIEALTWRLGATAPVPNIQLNFAGQSTAARDPVKGTRPVWFPETGFAPCKVYDRYALTAGMTFAGPAVIEERESTTVAGPDARITVDKYLNLIIDID
jgi:N-methylhydantoinase A